MSKCSNLLRIMEDTTNDEFLSHYDMQLLKPLEFDQMSGKPNPKFPDGTPQLRGDLKKANLVLYVTYAYGNDIEVYSILEADDNGNIVAISRTFKPNEKDKAIKFAEKIVKLNPPIEALHDPEFCKMYGFNYIES